jgi:hypothetical protein
MASAFKGIGKFLFGGGGSTPTPQAPPATPAPQQQPIGTASTNKAIDSPSFLAAAAPSPGAGATGKATLLGQ